MLQALQKLTRSGIARTMGLAMILAVSVAGTAVTHALDANQTHNFTIKIYEGDPSANKVVPGIVAKLVADDSSNASNGVTGTSDSNGEINFTNVHEGGFNVEIAHNISTYYGRDYHVFIDSDTTLEASILPQTSTLTKYNLTVRVFDGDPSANKLVHAAQVDVFADDSSSPTKDSTGTTDNSGNANFQLVKGGYTVKVGYNLPNDFYGRDYHIYVDSETTLEASLVSKTPPPPGDPTGDCLPTPPRGKPLLNIWPISESGAACTDYHFLAVKNETTGSGYVTGNGTVNATDGQIVQVELYVHNGVLDYPENIAHNVQVQAAVPTSSGTISASAWADNAEKITSAQKGGNVNIALGANQTLEFISGSTKLYDNKGAFQSNLPDGITGSGVSIGDMRGCYQFLHFVTFQLRVKSTTPPPTLTPNLTIVKTVSNITQNIGYQKSVQANDNDTVSFKLVITNTGNGDATHVVVKDVLPAGLSNLDAIDLNNIALGTIKAGESRTVTFSAKVNHIQCGTTLTNTASAQSNEVGPVTDSATITSPVCPPTGTPTLTIVKTVSNVTQNIGYQKSVVAAVGDTVSFKIVVTNTGDASATHVVVKDVLPAGLSNLDAVDLNNIALGTIAAGQSQTVTFKAKVNTINCSATITNTATASSNETAPVSDTATITSAACPPVTPTYTFSKSVRVVSSSSTFGKTASVMQSADGSGSNQVVEFKLSVAITSGTVQNLVINDVLPAGLTYFPGTLHVVTQDGKDVTLSDSLNQITLGTLSVNMTRDVYFKATVNLIASGTTKVLVNTATVTSDIGSKTDSATVVVNRPVIVNPNTTLSIVKTVANVTNNTDYLKNNTAKKGDNVDFRIVITNTGTTAATNVRLVDVLPDGITYADGLAVGTTNNWTGTPVVDPFLNIGTLNPGESVTVFFYGKVVSNLCSTKLTNVASTFADNASLVNDSATISLPTCIVNPPPYQAPPTGAGTTAAFVLAALTLIGFALYRTGQFSKFAKLTGLVRS